MFTESTDYSILFYMLDGCLLAVCVLSVWLTVTMRKSALTTAESLKKIWNKASLIFFTLLFMWGLMYGVRDTYVVPYLSDDLGASSQLISHQAYIYIYVDYYHALIVLTYRPTIFHWILDVPGRKYHCKEGVGTSWRTKLNIHWNSH